MEKENNGPCCSLLMWDTAYMWVVAVIRNSLRFESNLVFLAASGVSYGKCKILVTRQIV